jgi:transposase
MTEFDPAADASPCLPGLEHTQDAASNAAAEQARTQVLAQAPPRLRCPDRNQAVMQPCMIDELVDPDHPVRALWSVVEKLDLSMILEKAQARGSNPGRAGNDPRLMTALWLYASMRGVGTARELDRLCEEVPAFRWLCGGVSMNHHTLGDFRVDHLEALTQIFVDVVSALVMEGVAKVQRVSQDGTRVRASASSSSFRRGSTLEKLRADAREHMANLQAQSDPAWPSRQKAARERAAREKVERVDKAMTHIPQLQATKDSYGNRKDKAASKAKEPRVSTTDPEARVMKMPDGGYRPAYNVQIACDTESRAILAVDVVNTGSDRQQSQPLRQKVEEITGQKVKEHLMDGGFTHLDSIEEAGDTVMIYAPPPKTKDGVDPAEPKKGDKKSVALWRKRMGTEEAKEIYKERAATSETVNADLKTYRGLSPFVVRGIDKVLCVVLWCALAYNLMHFAKELLKA